MSNQDDATATISTITGLGTSQAYRDRIVPTFHSIPPCIAKEIGESMRMGDQYTQSVVDDPKDANIHIFEK